MDSVQDLFHAQSPTTPLLASRPSLRCAGIRNERIEIQRGHFKLEFGADEVQLKGRGHFLKNDQVKGAIKKIVTPGVKCAGGGEFFGAAEDTD